MAVVTEDRPAARTGPGGATTRRPDAGRTGLLLAVPGGLLLTVLHGTAAHAHLPVPLVALRDISFALPLVIPATMAALPAGRTLVRAGGLAGRAAALVRATVLAAGTAAGLGFGNAAHAALFGGHHHGLAPLADAVRVALIGFLALSPVALVISGGLTRPGWRPTRSGAPVVPDPGIRTDRA